MTTEWRHGQNRCGGKTNWRGLCILAFFFCFLLQKLRVWTRRRAKRFKPKIYLRRRKRRSTQWQKMTTIPKSQIPKITERKALFRGRVNTEAIQDQDLYHCKSLTHSTTNHLLTKRLSRFLWMFHAVLYPTSDLTYLWFGEHRLFFRHLCTTFSIIY